MKTLATALLVLAVLPTVAADISGTPTSDRQVSDIEAQISAQRIAQRIDTLVQFSTRHTLSETE